MKAPKRLRAIDGNGAGDGGGRENVFDRATVTILEDGRVEARIEKLAGDESEIIARTAQRRAASFIFNDLAPAVLADATKVKPFGGK